MTIDELYTEIEFFTETNDGVFTDAEKLRGINLDQNEALSLMLVSQGYRKVGEKTYYTDFVSNTGLTSGDNGYMGEYDFDTEWIKPIEFYVKFNGQTKYQKCDLYDISQNDNSEVDSDSINDTFNESNPYVRFARNSFFVRPLNTGATVSNGIMVVAEPRIDGSTSSSETPILDSIFHRWYVLKEGLRFGKFRSGVSRTDVERDLRRLEKRIKSHYSAKTKTPTKIRVPNESFK